MLAVAPIIYCASAAWTFSNQQVFRNKVVIEKTVDLFPPADHHFSQFWTQLTPGTPFLILFFILLVNNGGVVLDHMLDKSYFIRNLTKFK